MTTQISKDHTTIELYSDAFPSQITIFSELTSLSLVGNNLSNFPTEIGCLKNLKYLDLSNNNITHVSGKIGHLTKLEVLDLKKNQIETLPEEVGKLVNLRRVYLSKNKLTCFPKEFCELNELKVVNLDYNQITILPKEFNHFFSLKFFNINHNPLLFICDQIKYKTVSSCVDLNNNFLNYRCQSSFAKFVRNLAYNKNLNEIRAEFSELKKKDQNLICEMVCQLSVIDTPMTLIWGVSHVFDDLQRLHYAIRKSICTKFERQSWIGKINVYKRVYELAGCPKTHDAMEWGKRNAFKNVLRLIDAMNF